MTRKWEDKIILINDRIYGPGIGEPVGSMAKCISGESRLYTTIYDKRFINYRFIGHKVLGKYPLGSSGWLLNNFLTGITFHKFKTFIETESNTKLIHYTSQQVVPLTKKNSTVTVHDLIPVLVPEETKRIVRIRSKLNFSYYKSLPIVSAVSETTRRTMIKMGFSGEIYITPNTVSDKFHPIAESTDTIRSRIGLPLDKKLVLSVGSNARRKNLHIVEKVMDLLGPEYSLVRVGVGIKNSINYTNIDIELLNEIYNACDVFLMPSSYEGFGLPVLEAMKSGIPVIASNIEVFREVTDNSAILTEIDPPVIANAVKEAIDNREELILKGLERAKHYSYENFCNKLMLFYKRAFAIYGL